MCYTEKYINPFTDFGFKKIFGDEENTELLNRMTDIPQELKNDVIAKAFEKAEFIKLPKEEQEKYHRNLKIYRDLLNSYNTAHKTGMQEGIEQGIKQRNQEIAQKLLQADMSVEFIVEATGLSVEEIERFRL